MEEKGISITITNQGAHSAAIAIEETAASFFNVFEDDAMRLAANKDGCGMEWFLSYYKKLDSAIYSIHTLASMVRNYLEAVEAANG